MTVLFLLVLGFFPVVWTVYCSYCLLRNYLIARKVGLPVIAGPITPDNPLWIAVQVIGSSIVRHVPFSSIPFFRYSQLSWEFHDNGRTHQRLGDAFILATPVRNWLYVIDPETVVSVLSRGHEFSRCIWQLESLSVFGPNIAVAEDQDYLRQRKLTTTPFNEQKSPLIWSEALRQTNEMLKIWCASSSQGLTSTTDDTKTLALHVLAFVAFQKSYPYESVAQNPTSNSRSDMTYRDSLSIILNNIFAVLIFPRSSFSYSFLPLAWQQIGWAIEYFRKHMLDQMEEERVLVRKGEPGSNTLVGNLVRASDEGIDRKSLSSNAATFKPLTESEIMGNIFVFNFAGHDTTSISLAYGILLLVAHQDIQDWLHEEIQYHTQGKDIKLFEYSELYPKLKRCQAVLLETVRLYNPLPGMPKYTRHTPRQLVINGKTYQVPADTVVAPNLPSSHTDPRYWGSDSRVWRPQRWIEQPAKPGQGSLLEIERLFVPKRGMFYPWSEGLRSCPGKKFAQVEFVAVVAGLLQHHIGAPVPLADESMEGARKRLLGVVQNSYIRLLLAMRDPYSIAVRWEERK